MTAPYFATMSLASMDPAASAWPEMRAILDELPDLAGPPLDVQPLPGGLTNRNYRVITHRGREVVVRVSAEQSTLLQIDRDAEHRNAVAASRAGVGSYQRNSVAVAVMVVSGIQSLGPWTRSWTYSIR